MGEGGSTGSKTAESLCCIEAAKQIHPFEVSELMLLLQQNLDWMLMCVKDPRVTMWYLQEKKNQYILFILHQIYI